jgi:hypothetical protein
MSDRKWNEDKSSENKPVSFTKATVLFWGSINLGDK